MSFCWVQNQINCCIDLFLATEYSVICLILAASLLQQSWLILFLLRNTCSNALSACRQDHPVQICVSPETGTYFFFLMTNLNPLIRFNWSYCFWELQEYSASDHQMEFLKHLWQQLSKWSFKGFRNELRNSCGNSNCFRLKFSLNLQMLLLKIKLFN